MYCFLIDPVSVDLMMGKLRDWANSLGLRMNTSGVKGGGRSFQVEIFPKQASAPAGNWINLPYFGDGDDAQRWGVRDGRRLSLDDWLDHAEENQISSARFRSWHTHDPNALFSDGPICLETLARDGITQGMRNTVIFNAATYFNVKFPDNWIEKTEEFNELHVDPPLGDDELNKTLDSRGRGTHWYQCETSPLCDVCDRKACQQRKYGVDAQKDNTAMPKAMPPLGKLTFVKSEPARWYLDVDGQRVTLTTDQLLSGSLFRKAATEQLGRFIPLMKGAAWDKFVEGAMKEKDVIEPPLEMSIFGRFLTLFGQFAEQRVGAQDDNAVRRGKPIEKVNGDGVRYVVFPLDGLRSFLDRNRFYEYKDTDLFPRLKMLGAVSKRETVGGVQIRLWWVPVDNISEFIDEDNIEPSRDDSPSF